MIIEMIVCSSNLFHLLVGKQSYLVLFVCPHVCLPLFLFIPYVCPPPLIHVLFRGFVHKSCWIEFWHYMGGQYGLSLITAEFSNHVTLDASMWWFTGEALVFN